MVALMGGAALFGPPSWAQPAGPSAGTYTVDGGSYAIELHPQGDTLVVVEPNKQSTYQRQPDGSFHVYNPNTSATYGIRVVDDHTIEAFKPDQPRTVPTRLSRVGGSPPPPTPSLPGAAADAAPAAPPPAVAPAPLPPSVPAVEDRYGALARSYEQRAKDDPDSVHIWAACAAAAQKRSVVNTAEADAYAVQMVQMLKVIMVDTARSPCEDAIPATLWRSVAVNPAMTGVAPAPPDPAAQREAAAAAERARLDKLNAEADARAAATAARLAGERRAYDAKVAEAQAAQDRFARDQAAYEADAAKARAAAEDYQRQLDAYRRSGGKGAPPR